MFTRTIMDFWNRNFLSYWRKLWPNCLAAATLLWQPNVERDLAGYKVYIGEKPKQYNTVVNVGKRTRYSLDSLPRDKTYYLAVTAYDASGNESAHSQEVVLPAAAGGDTTLPSNEKTLERTYNFPNPFRAGNGATTVRYYLADPGRVSINVYDVKGDLIKTVLDQVQRSAGENLGEVWDGTDLNGVQVSPGLYYVEVKTQNQRSVVKVVVMP
ncbi:T9SS type A sorting domain-containing protein [candidate division KSB1 bacterium]|nr:T9SS type A sorting domain-containing protein [candidate division KSB1 bacterium]